MNEHDVIRHMGRFPDAIVTECTRMKSKLWRCDRCQRVYQFSEERNAPNPCAECGGIFWTKLREEAPKCESQS